MPDPLEAKMPENKNDEKRPPVEILLDGRVRVSNGLIRLVHDAEDCAGRNCWIHNPSGHHLREWPVVYREDRGSAERRCEHGIGHPDPDSVAYWIGRGRDDSIHACDGCCGAALPDAAASLGPASTGLWRITADDAVYVLDLRPRRTWPPPRLIRRPTSPPHGWRYDHTDLSVIEVHAWPMVHGRMRLVVDDPDGSIGGTLLVDTGVIASIVEIIA